MAYRQPTPYSQQNHIPPLSDTHDSSGQLQVAVRSGTYNATQGCSCAWCSATRYNEPPVWGAMQYQNPWLPGDLTISSGNQILGAHNSTGIGAMANAQPQAPLFVPQVYPRWDQGTAGYASASEGARFPQAQTNAGLDQPQAINAQVTESLRRLAGRLLNNPESLVNVVRVEPGATGRFRVVIILEVADVS